MIRIKIIKKLVKKNNQIHRLLRFTKMSENLEVLLQSSPASSLILRRISNKSWSTRTSINLKLEQWIWISKSQKDNLFQNSIWITIKTYLRNGERKIFGISFGSNWLNISSRATKYKIEKMSLWKKFKSIKQKIIIIFLKFDCFWQMIEIGWEDLMNY